MMIWNVRNWCRILLVIDLDRIESYTVVKRERKKHVFLSEGMYEADLWADLGRLPVPDPGCDGRMQPRRA